MAILAPWFKACVMWQVTLSCSGLLAIVLSAQGKPRIKPENRKHKEAAMIDQQIDIETKDGKRLSAHKRNLV